MIKENNYLNQCRNHLEECEKSLEKISFQSSRGKDMSKQNIVGNQVY